jgi:RHS repeat-associated protein
VPDENPSGLGTFDFSARFPGQYFDRETALAYNFFRDYSADSGRYIESDPIGLAGGPNTYTYVANIPIVLSDLFRLQASCPNDTCEQQWTECYKGAEKWYHDCIHLYHQLCEQCSPRREPPPTTRPGPRTSRYVRSPTQVWSGRQRLSQQAAKMPTS